MRSNEYGQCQLQVKKKERSDKQDTAKKAKDIGERYDEAISSDDPRITNACEYQFINNDYDDDDNDCEL